MNIRRKIRKWYRNNTKAIIVVSTLVLTVAMYAIQIGGGNYFQANILSLKESQISFDGTTYPIKKVPNWIKADTQNNRVHYGAIPSDLFIDLPEYNPKELQTPVADLLWGNPIDDVIRNAKLTFSVVYMGNYKLDGTEYAGSHPAIDIRVPTGTPIYAMANGIVTKSKKSNSGFGNHVVIKHPNVPDFPNTSKTTNLYSSYSHMDSIDVEEGDVVVKGEKIGTVGNTGTSTTPHLHFQLDREDVAWHPYWHFTFAEASAAGLSYVGAIDAGFKQEEAAKFTIHPFLYIQEFLNTSPQTKPGNNNSTENTDEEENTQDENTENTNTNNESNNTNQESNTDAETDEEMKEDEDQDITENPGESSNNEENTIENDISTPENETPEENTQPFSLELTAEPFYFVGKTARILVVARDPLTGDTLRDFQPDSVMRISHNGNGQLFTDALTNSTFKNGVARIEYSSETEETAKITVGDYATNVSFIAQITQPEGFNFVAEDTFTPGEAVEVELFLVDADNNPTPDYSFFNPTEITVEKGDVEISKTTYSKSDWKTGKVTITVNTNKDTKSFKLSASNNILNGESQTFQARIRQQELFTDIPKNHKNYEAISYLQENNIINGYPDGTFRPGKTVNRAEALKILLLGLEIELVEKPQLTFSDTKNSEWYAEYLATAVEKTIVNGYPDGTFRPGNTVNTAEFIKILLELTNTDIPETLAESPYNDVPVSAWYAPYAKVVKDLKLIDVSNNLLNPEKGMTRGDVAEMLYRQLTIDS